MTDGQFQLDAVVGAVLGCAVGDAIGLPYENLTRRRGHRLLGTPDRHRFILGRGMVSDDTEHTCMVAQSLCRAPNDPDAFARDLARQLRWWLLGLPAGIGFATLRATMKLWLGFSPRTSGVFSAGNGPAMRSAFLGASIDNSEALRQFVLASTRITHTDPKAFRGAMAVAVAARCAKRGPISASEFRDQYRSAANDDACAELESLLAKMESSLAARESTPEFAERLGCRQRVSGYVYQTVPVALHAWLSHPRDFGQAIMSVIQCGGDTDTTAAIVGAIVGAGVGRNGIPIDWLEKIREWPRSVDWMVRTASTAADAIHKNEPQNPPRVLPLVGLARNAVFLTIVLGHIGRRALPPY